MNDLVFAFFASDCPKMKSVFVYRRWFHLFIAVFAKDCVFEYICHVYTCCIYFIKFWFGKSYKWFLFDWWMREIVVGFKKFWKFLHKDSWSSFAVTLLLAVVVIKFVFFSGLSYLTGTPLPLVIVESCSMHHYENGFGKIFNASDVYSEKNIFLSDTVNWIFQDGFNKGDVIFVVGVKNIKVGDVIIFESGSIYPLIHRVVEVGDSYATKGDNYKTNSGQLDSEKMISEEQIIGKALFKIPFVGWIKLIFFEFGKNPQARGFCR